MNLTIDIGNTQCKLIVFDDTIPVYRLVRKSLRVGDLRKIFAAFSIQHALVSSVVPLSTSLTNAFKKYRVKIFSPQTPIPLKNRYQTPKTLGKDRLAGAIAARFLFPDKNVLVIDMGTWIKYDFVNAKKEYLGGSISPGLNMRFLAMNKFTGKLPLAKNNDPKRLIGNSTETALQTGVYNGILAEINGVITEYRRHYHNLTVIITGGDSNRFVHRLNLSIFAASDLVNIGLNEIIKHNNA